MTFIQAAAAARFLDAFLYRSARGSHVSLKTWFMTYFSVGTKLQQVLPSAKHLVFLSTIVTLAYIFLGKASEIEGAWRNFLFFSTSRRHKLLQRLL